MTTSKYDDFKDVFYHCIPILNAPSKKEVSSKIRLLASELYDEQTTHLQSILDSDSLTKESWIRRAQRLVINPDYDHQQKLLISAFASAEAVPAGTKKCSIYWRRNS